MAHTNETTTLNHIVFFLTPQRIRVAYHHSTALIKADAVAQ